MHRMLHKVIRQMILAGGLCIGLAGLVPSVSGQANLDPNALERANVHDLSPFAGWLRLALWSFAAALLVIAGVMIALRYRGATDLYRAVSDDQWNDDSREDAGRRVDESEIVGACEDLENAVEPVAAAKGAAEPAPPLQSRLFTPASGTAWSESMLKAFLGTCMKVNCLGQTWREAAARRAEASNLPDPREAELIRRLMQRWHEFHVDPESGVFLERSSPGAKGRVCIISVSKDKRTLVEAAFNAGFVIESVGRYLKSTDLVYRRSHSEYHAPTRADLTAMTPSEKESMMRITEIPDPWEAMIAGSSGALHQYSGGRTGANSSGGVGDV